MKSSSHSTTPPRGFTLIELLVVIAIIAILSSMMFVGAASMMKKAKIARAENTALNLKNAINAYVTEYRKLPTRKSSQTETELLSDETLMNVLCASPSETGEGGLSPRSVVFYSDRTAKPMGDGKYHSGIFIDADGNASLTDPWGEPYRVLLDTGNRGRLKKPAWDQSTGSYEISESILVWSTGPDGENESKANDNIKTW